PARRAAGGREAPLDPAAAGLELLILDTRARHALADGRYAERRRACEEAAATLGVRSLRDVADDRGAPAKLTEHACQRAARHVIEEYRRVLAASALLRAGELARLGGL